MKVKKLKRISFCKKVKKKKEKERKISFEEAQFHKLYGLSTYIVGLILTNSFINKEK
jgi:hypothetical protein